MQKLHGSFCIYSHQPFFFPPPTPKKGFEGEGLHEKPYYIHALFSLNHICITNNAENCMSPLTKWIFSEWSRKMCLICNHAKRPISKSNHPYFRYWLKKHLVLTCLIAIYPRVYYTHACINKEYLSWFLLHTNLLQSTLVLQILQVCQNHKNKYTY